MDIIRDTAGNTAAASGFPADFPPDRLPRDGGSGRVAG
jgi:hypothetical protein